MAEEEDKSKGKRFTKEFVEKWSKTTEQEPSPEEAILEKQKKMLDEDPKNIKLWFARGRLLMDMNRNGEAIECLDKVTQLDPEFPGAWNARAEVLRRLGRLEESADSLRQALAHVAPQVDERFRETLEKKESIEEVLKAVTAEEAPRKAAPPTTGVPPEEPQPPEKVTKALEELETMSGDEKPPEDETPEQKEFREKIKKWAAQGFDVDPIKEVLAKEPYKARTAFFQFEQNVAKVGLLQETLEGIKTPGFEREIERIMQGMKSPYNIWKVEAEMGDLLVRIEEAETSAGKAAAEEELRVISEAPPAKEFEFETAQLPRRAVKVSRAASLRPVEGRVNGMVRAGRVNGLVNGLAAEGRVNGLAATGRVNGLVNGLRSARRGMTNGLTNGNGFTNGLGSSRFRRDLTTRRWKILLIPVIAAILIFIPVLSSPLGQVFTPPGGVTVDGSPAEWSGVPGYTQIQDVASDSINITAYKAQLKDDVLSLLVQVKGTVFVDPSRITSLYAFIDVDGSMLTGYDTSESGADAMIEVDGMNGTISGTTLWLFTDSNPGGRDNWTAWQQAGSIVAASSGGWIEFQVDDRRLVTNSASFDAARFRISLVMDDNMGMTSTSMVQMSASHGALIVRQKGGPKAVFGGGIEDLFTIEFEAVGSTVHVNNVEFMKSPDTVTVNTVADFDVVPGQPTTKVVRVNTQSSDFNDFLSLEVSNVDANRPAKIIGESAKAYVGVYPTNKRVDGIFSDWNATELLGDTDPRTVYPSNLDFTRHGTNKSDSNLFLYLDVRGRIMQGTDIVQVKTLGGPSQVPPPLPEAPALKKGEDILRAYIDSDSQDAAGSPVLGLPGADYMIEVKGRHGRISNRTLYRWSGGWVLAGSAVAEKDERSIEMGIDLSGITVRAMQVAFEASSWRSVADITLASSVRSRTRSSEGTTYETLYSAILPNEISDGKRITFEAKSAFLKWTLPSEVLLVDGDDSRSLAGLTNTLLRAGPDHAEYPSAYSNMDMDIQYLLEEESLKEQFILNSPIIGLPVSPSVVVRFQFEMTVDSRLMTYVDGAGPQERITTSRAISFMMHDREVFSIAPASAWDADGQSINIPYIWEKSGPTLSLDVPASYLAESSYPVYIDPWVTYDLTNTGPMGGRNEQLGNKSVAIGDFDNDGYADVLAGGPYNNRNGTNGGGAYIYRGPFSSSKSAPDVNINGTSGCRRGFAVAAGLINNDNYWDAIVTQRACKWANTTIYYGRATPWTAFWINADVTIKPQNLTDMGSLFGSAVAVGNVDGKFNDDVIIGSPGASVGLQGGHGRAYVFLSPLPTVVSNANFTLLPPTDVIGMFGWSIATGLIDDDTAYDVVVGEPSYVSQTGRVSLFKGSSLSSGSGDKQPNAYLVGSQSGEQFGYSVAVGKLNSDDYRDVAVGAPFYTSSSIGDGRIHLFLASSSGLTTGQASAATVSNQRTKENFGVSVLIGPLMEPGSYQLAVGAPTSAGGGTMRGSVYIFTSPLTSSTPSFTISGTYDYEGLGYGLAGGKFSGDTYYQIAIGAPRYQVGAVTQAGRVVVLYYIPEFSNVAIVFFGILSIGLAVHLRKRRINAGRH